jgi:hypothetical protein
MGTRSSVHFEVFSKLNIVVDRYPIQATFCFLSSSCLFGQFICFRMSLSFLLSQSFLTRMSFVIFYARERVFIEWEHVQTSSSTAVDFSLTHREGLRNTRSDCRVPGNLWTFVVLDTLMIERCLSAKPAMPIHSWPFIIGQMFNLTPCSSAILLLQ